MTLAPPLHASSDVGGGLLSLETAQARMLTGLIALPVVDAPLDGALGRVLAVELPALVTLPPWDNSAMDGFAVRSADVAGATRAVPVALRVVGEVAAGHAPDSSVMPGSALRILTGAMLPPGADAVVPVEATDALAGHGDPPDSVLVSERARPGDHVRRAGSDLVAGTLALAAGTVLGPAALGLLAAAGHASAPVHRAPRVAVLSTGDELVAPGMPLGPGQIHDSNGAMLAAQARTLGAEVEVLSPAPDDLGAVTEVLTQAVGRVDVVVVSGGVSVGARDVVKEGFERVGRMELWRVAVQPGKPLAFGRTDSGVLLFGLPGNPVSSFVTFELFVRPVLRLLAGHEQPLARVVRTARLAEAVVKAPGRRAFLRVALTPDPSRPGRFFARLAGGQGSHVLSALVAADGLAVVPESVEALPEGAEVEVWELARP